MKPRHIAGGLAMTAALLAPPIGGAGAQEAKKPNILFIMGDDVGWFNIGAYHQGIMSGKTPNLDKLAAQGMRFTDYYAEASCTAGRANFITGELPIRTGLTTVGQAGADVGMPDEAVTLATVLKAQGYATGQFGKNHLGDLNKFLPTVHGFDEFFGYLYHLDAMSDPYWHSFPQGWWDKSGPRDLIHSWATDKDDPTEMPRWGKVGKQRIEDEGPLAPFPDMAGRQGWQAGRPAKYNMETFDSVLVKASEDFMDKAKKAGKPFFVWHNTAFMHIYTHLKPAARYQAADISSADDVYGSGMMELDRIVGRLLKKLEELKIADNTIVLFTSDNGAMSAWWPDGGTQPFRGEKATTWEGGVRVPMLVRWPARIKAGRVSNGIQSHLDLFTTLAAAAGVADAAARLRQSNQVKIDGVDNLAHWTADAPSARNHFIYYNESKLAALRFGPWKGHLQERNGFFDFLRPSYLLFNLRMDPFEQHDGHASNLLAMKKAFLGGVMRDILAEHYRSLKEHPPRQSGGSLRAQ